MAPDPLPGSTTRRRAVLVLLGVFLAGAAAGSGATLALRGRRWSRMSGNKGFFAPDSFARLYARSLDLSDAQLESLRPVFERHSKDFLAINRRTLPEHRALNHALDAEILHVLQEHQLEKFRTMQEGRDRFLSGWAGDAATDGGAAP